MSSCVDSNSVVFFPELLELERSISRHPVAERPMLYRLCRSFLDLVFVLDQLDCTLVDVMLYPNDFHQPIKK